MKRARKSTLNQDVVIKMNEREKHLVFKPALWGISGSMVLLGIYFLIVSLANSFQHALQEFFRIWYWIALLVLGFGIQLGLYIYARGFIKLRELIGVSGNIATTGGISTGSMVACCAHHLSDFLPLLGLSAAALFFNTYQVFFIVVGILSNLVGITYMFFIIQKHGLYERGRILHSIMRFDMKKLLYGVLMGSIGIAFVTFFMI